MQGQEWCKDKRSKENVVKMPPQAATGVAMVPRNLGRMRRGAWFAAVVMTCLVAVATLSFSPSYTVLEGMNDANGNVITPEYSVAAAMQTSALGMKHYPDPQAMPDAQLILATENADAAALRRLRTMAFKVHQMRVKATDTARRWTNLLEKGRDVEYSTLDMQSETPDLRKPRGNMGPPGPAGPPGVSDQSSIP